MIDFFISRITVSTFILSFVTVIILLIRKLFRRHISIRWQYNIWFLLFFLLIVPLIPPFVNIGRLYHIFSNIDIIESINENFLTINNGSNNLFSNVSWMKDFTVSVSRFSPRYINMIILGIWMIGMLIVTIITIKCNGRIRLIKESLQSIKNKEVNALFEKCKADLSINQNIVLGKSELTKTPIAIGFFKPYIILPSKIIKQLSINEIKYIMLHELNHYKNKDILVNYVMCVFQIVYWFNPLIYLAFKEMRLDREIVCDHSVLRMLNKDSYIDYGRTIINFAEKISQSSPLLVAVDMSDAKKQIKKRIERIADYTTETRLLTLKSIGIFAFIGFLIFSQIPTISAITYDDNKYNFKGNGIGYEDLSAYFDAFEGSFVLYNLKADKFTIYNKEKSTTRVSPESTYKIFSALIALEQNIIQQKDSTLNWDGSNYPFDDWNQDQDLYTAMKYSVSWYFQNIDKQVGKKTLETYFEQIGYGNCDLSGGIMYYWMESSLRISPIEQVQLLKDFYNNDLVFKQENIDIVKKSLRLSEKDGAMLSGKTGTGAVNGKGVNGWFIGYVEKNENTYIFATNIQGKDKASGSVAAEITLKILQDWAIY